MRERGGTVQLVALGNKAKGCFVGWLLERLLRRLVLLCACVLAQASACWWGEQAAA